MKPKLFIRNLLYLTLFLCSNEYLNAQTDTVTSNSIYFDDGGEHLGRQHIIKLSPTAMLAGEIPIFYEYTISNRFSLETGFGLLLPWYLTYEFEHSEGEGKGLDIIEGRDPGHRIWLMLKSHPFRKAPESLYYGIRFRRSAFSKHDEPLIFYDFSATLGYQFFMSKKLVFDFGFGGGYKFDSKFRLSQHPDYAPLFLTFIIKLGITL